MIAWEAELALEDAVLNATTKELPPDLHEYESWITMNHKTKL